MNSLSFVYTFSFLAKYRVNGPYSRRGHDGQKERLGLQIYRKCARQYVNCDATSLLLQESPDSFWIAMAISR